MAGGEDVGLSEGFFFFFEATGTYVYADENDPDE